MRKAPRITQTKHIVTLLKELQYKGPFNINTILDWLFSHYNVNHSSIGIETLTMSEMLQYEGMSFKDKLEIAIEFAENLLNSTNVQINFK